MVVFTFTKSPIGIFGLDLTFLPSPIRMVPMREQEHREKYFSLWSADHKQGRWYPCPVDMSSLVKIMTNNRVALKL